MSSLWRSIPSIQACVFRDWKLLAFVENWARKQDSSSSSYSSIHVWISARHVWLHLSISNLAWRENFACIYLRTSLVWRVSIGLWTYHSDELNWNHEMNLKNKTITCYTANDQCFIMWESNMFRSLVNVVKISVVIRLWRCTRGWNAKGYLKCNAINFTDTM